MRLHARQSRHLSNKTGDKKKMFCVYALIHPKTKEIRYIGKTYSNNLRTRLLRHISRALVEEFSPTHKNRWIRKLYNEDLKPEIILMSKLFKDEFLAFECEKELISIYPNLTNATKGGEGITGYSHTDATKQMLREDKIGRKHSEETKQKMSETRKGRKFSSSHKENISKSLKLHVKTKEHCKNISKSKLGKRQSKEAIEKTRNKNLGKKRTPEQCKEISERKKIWWAEIVFDDETKTYLSRKEIFSRKQKGNKHNVGKTLTEVHKKKLSQARRVWWKNKKKKETEEIK